MTARVLGTLILIFTVIKPLTILGDGPTLGRLVLAGDRHRRGRLHAVQEAGGVETLKSEATSLGIVRCGGERHAAAPPSGTSARAGSTCAGTTGREYGERGPGRSLRRGGCGLGRSERRAVDRAGQLVPLTARNPAAVAPRRGCRSLVAKRLEIPHLAHSRVPCGE